MLHLRIFNKSLWLFLSIFFSLSASVSKLPIAQASAYEKDYHRLVMIGDPHLPGESISAKEDVVKDINSWNDVDRVVVLGDICSELGTSDEYAYAKQFFSKVQKTIYFITGNHDYIYEDQKSLKGSKVKGSSASRKAKLQLFKETFGLSGVYYSKKVGNYLLVFLSPDDLSSDYLAKMSNSQFDWLRSELAGNRETPTMIFFHAPLKGTLHNYNENANTENFIAQPHEKIRETILDNPQIFLWISGHMHTPATNESFNSPINIYEKQVTNIHNANINRNTIWTNSLYLYPDKVVVKTYNHKKGGWMGEMERIIVPTRK